MIIMDGKDGKLKLGNFRFTCGSSLAVMQIFLAFPTALMQGRRWFGG
jgi:hypothetical protein